MSECKDVCDYIVSLRNTLHQVESYTRKNLAIEVQRQADYYNKNHLGRKLDVGDNVLVRETRNNPGTRKYKFYGPFQIKRKLGE